MLFLLAPGCGSGGDSSGGDVVRDGNTLRSDESPLVLQIPPDLPATASEASLEAIYRAAAAQPACQDTTGAPVDLVLAQACVAYQESYLYPENLPPSLDPYPEVSDYVAALRQDDPFTSFFSASTFQDQVTPTLSGSRATIGIRVEIAGGADTIGPDAPLRIIEVLPFTRAWYDGLREGDEIVAVDRPPTVQGQALDGLTLTEALDLMPRQEGEAVTLTVRRGTEPLDIATAAELHLGFAMAPGIAYLSVRSYTSLTGAEVQADYQRLVGTSNEVIDKLILDLRHDGGGSVAGALALTDYLIDRDDPPHTNPIVSFEDRGGNGEVDYLGANPSNLPNLSPANFVVLVDGDSASASEITVAALRDYGVARIIGTQTFGKGVSQNVATLVDGSGLFITARSILGPSGESWNGVGITPDEPVDGTVTQDDDPQLTAAVRWLTTGTPVARPVAPRVPSAGAARTDPWLRQLEIR